jgi:hypothetical protein
MVTLEVHLMNGERITVEKNLAPQEAYRRLATGPQGMAALVSGPTGDASGSSLVVPPASIAYVKILGPRAAPEVH